MRSARGRFTELVTAYADDLYRFGYWLCGNRAEADDLVQDTLARAWRALDQLRDERAAKSWLFTTLRREHSRHCSRARLRTVALDPDSISDESRSFDDTAEAHALRRALANLAAEYREPLVLQIVGGFSGEEIGAMLGLTVGAVNVRLHRARRQLRAALADREPVQSEDLRT
jgi:RNA polymerase sigma-70 factor (ECF subfamily)